SSIWSITVADDSPHVISVSFDDHYVTVTVDGTAQSRPLETVSGLAVAGGAGADAFTIEGTGSASVPVTLDGGPGDDSYKLGDHFGDVTIADSAHSGAGTLDFTGNTGTIAHPDAVTFTSSTGGTLTLRGPSPKHIDLAL